MTGQRFLQLIFVYIILSLLLVGLSGCRDAVGDDWHQYQRASNPIIPEEQAAVAALNGIDQKRPPLAKILQVLKEEVAPRYKRVIETLNRLHPRTEPVRQYHLAYRKFADKFSSCVDLWIHAIEQRDDSKLSVMDKMMKDGMADLQKAGELKKMLNDKYGFAS